MKRSKIERYGARMTDTAYSRLPLKKEIKAQPERRTNWNDWPWNNSNRKLPYIDSATESFGWFFRIFKWIKEIFIRPDKILSKNVERIRTPEIKVRPAMAKQIRDYKRRRAGER